MSSIKQHPQVSNFEKMKSEKKLVLKSQYSLEWTGDRMKQ